jgi:hypothetical protein
VDSSRIALFVCLFVVFMFSFSLYARDCTTVRVHVQSATHCDIVNGIKGKKVKSLCLIKYCTMKTYGRVDV